jgi:rubrerythrin
MTNIPFSAEETLKIAIEIETNGREFYEEMLEETDDQEINEVFRDLANQEVKHRKTFEEMLGDVETEEGPDLNSLLYGELEDSYLSALADSKVFTPANENIEEARRVDNRDELLSIAISLEKDTILYYYEILQNAKNSGDQDLIMDIINEEKSHVKRLAGLY